MVPDSKNILGLHTNLVLVKIIKVYNQKFRGKIHKNTFSFETKLYKIII